MTFCFFMLIISCSGGIDHTQVEFSTKSMGLYDKERISKLSC